MTRTSSSKCPPALSVEEESKGRVARTIYLETNRVPHHAGFACGVFDSSSHSPFSLLLPTDRCSLTAAHHYRKSLPLNSFADPHLLTPCRVNLLQKQGGGVPPAFGFPTLRRAKCKPGGAPRLLINVVLSLKPLEQGLQERLRRIRRSADRLRHFFSSRREVSAVRRDACQRQVADPVIRVLPRNLRIQFKSALGVARSLHAASVRVQLNRAGFIKRLGKHFGGFFLFSHGLQDARLGLQILKPLFILDRGVFPLQRLLQLVIV